MKSGFYHSGDGYVSCFATSSAYSFRLMVRRENLASPEGFAVVEAWALGVATIPGAGIDLAEMETLVDRMEEVFGAKRVTTKRRFRLF